MLTNLEIFFWSADAKKKYGHRNIKFPRPFWIFEKWTFINVQKRKSDFTFGKKNCIFYIYYRFSYLKNYL
jgi:hypothetical protein